MTVPRRRSPRERRLYSDYRSMLQLAEDSSIIRFQTQGDPPEFYRIRFQGQGLWKPSDSGAVQLRDSHEVAINLTSAYPRMIPEIQWLTPIFHPNISGSGVVCLGGYGTHWVPSLMLAELCHMLWDMIRYKNYDIESPYNREAAVWTRDQRSHRLPIDDRQLRNRVTRETLRQRDPLGGRSQASTDPTRLAAATPDSLPEVQFIDPDPEPTLQSDHPGDGDILFID